MIRHHGFDFPLHRWGRDEILFEKTDYRAAVERELHSFVRVCHTSGPTGDTLANRLRRARAGFRRFADVSGAAIMPHTFGLALITPNQQRTADSFVLALLNDQNRTGITPPDHLLVARVPTLVPTPDYVPYDERCYPRAMHEGVQRYVDEVKTSGEGLSDVGVDQILPSRPFIDPSAAAQYFITDIEPVVIAPI
ncbi:hypothetical protein EKI60_03310 [Candidatus Saccharibacteria bacterium]|nr:MAG: hypothetical protein EKI60_03310 [Candidatus Saccharibacteria bacterium]